MNAVPQEMRKKSEGGVFSSMAMLGAMAAPALAAPISLPDLRGLASTVVSASQYLQ